ncbi:MAG TPA: DUF2339 domain-containing protein [Acidobacteriaceae bacterium]|nr:DUF2339 domain-containing protein [Acidobacteriaceae bacterium]
MANDEFSGASGSTPGGGSNSGPNPDPDLHVLEARIARLEQDLAALRRQVAGSPEQAAAQAWVSREAPAAAPPPPPVPTAIAQVEAPDPTLKRLQWSDRTTADQEQPRAQPVAVERSRESLESRLGSQYFNRIAIVLLLIGTAYGMKLAVDSGLIGPMPRVILGLLAGAGLVLWSERFRRKGFAAFSYSLKALGSGVLYLALWAAFRLYGLVPAPVALLLMVLVTAWNAYMAWAQNSELLAGYALAGGFATPILLSTGGNHEIFLFTYLLAIDLATVALVRLRRWPRLLLAAFPLTVGYFIGWYAEFFTSADAFGITCFFVALFAAVFATVPLFQGTGNREQGTAGEFAGGSRFSTVLEDILLPLANSAFAALAYYSVLQDSGRHSWLPWMMLLLAAVYLGIMQLPQSAVASAIHLSIAIVLLTIAIPLKASGHWITVSWLVEGLALTWVATRLTPEDEATAYAANTLRWLAMASLLLGFGGVFVHVADSVTLGPLPVFNKATGTALTAVAAFAAAAWLALQASSQRERRDAERWTQPARIGIALIPITAALLTFRELNSWVSLDHPPFQTSDFLTALLALAIFAGVIATCMRQIQTHPDAAFWRSCAAIVTIAFNFIAVLTGVREVDALFAPVPNAWTADAVLQQSLAISGFLMLYGAVLLAIGFWKRSGFLRWQALALLVFTVVKAFVYDMRSLSQGYRVVSLMALGALLLAVSFAYQKDWLNLKGTRHVPGEQDAQ